MADDRTDDADSAPSASAPHNWIDEIASSEDIDRDEVIQRLISAYWTLKEMEGLLEQTGVIDPGADGQLDGFGPSDRDAVESEVGELRERLSQLENRVDELSRDRPHRGEIEMLEERITGIERSLTAQHNDLRKRFDDELANLSDILEYLMDTTDALEQGIETVADGQIIDRGWLQEQKDVGELKELAARLGVRTANCEECDTSLDIALLTTPSCPECNRTFVDIDPDARWLGLGSNKLRVRSGPSDSSPAASEAHRSPSTKERDTFVWGEDRH